MGTYIEPGLDVPHIFERAENAVSGAIDQNTDIMLSHNLSDSILGARIGHIKLDPMSTGLLNLRVLLGCRLDIPCSAKHFVAGFEQLDCNMKSITGRCTGNQKCTRCHLSF